MARLLKGSEVVAEMNEALRNRIEALQEQNITPMLEIVRVGERPDDIAYERGVTKRCEKVGVEVKKVLLPEDVTQDELIEVIEQAGSDDDVHGVLMFRPLPAHIDEDAVCNRLDPSKDVDGITRASMAGVFMDIDRGFVPCTAQACLEVLKYYKVDLKGRNITILGRSLVVGKPLAMLLMRENATVTVCHSKTEGLQDHARNADILIAAMGRAEMVDGSYLSEDQIVLDVGINMNQEGHMCGDVKQADAENIVAALTPVPGGIGTVTSSVLAAHVVESAEHAADRQGAV